MVAGAVLVQAGQAGVVVVLQAGLALALHTGGADWDCPDLLQSSSTLTVDLREGRGFTVKMSKRSIEVLCLLGKKNCT